MVKTIRALNPADARAINLLSGQLGYPVAVEQTLSNINEVISAKDHVALVAEVNGSIAGWIHAFKCVTIESAPFVEIAGLVVDEKYRKQHIGKNLVKAVKDWSVKKNIVQIRVRSNIVREEAHQFYLAFGFGEVKQQKVFSLDLDIGRLAEGSNNG